jgi:hypothetical protein
VGPRALRGSGIESLVPKPWGYEYCAFDNGKAAIWILQISRGKKTSRHCHPNKRTVLVPLQGEVRVNGEIVRVLDPVVIEKGVFHQTEVSLEETYAQSGAFLMEIEEPSNKGDIIRDEDAYGRAGKPIESETVPCVVETLKISHRAQSLMGYTFKLESTLGGPIPDLTLPVGGEVLGIYRDEKKKVSDVVADFVKAQGVSHVFGVCGGGSMHLDDSFRDIFVPMHHEQAAAMAAEAYARVNGLGVCLVTTGPGGTNAITGLSCAWVDSIPVLFISGQVTRESMMTEGDGLRQRGIQETNIVAMVRPNTKYAVCVTDESQIRVELKKSLTIAKEGQPGPVWIDIPLDVQSKRI